MPNSFILNICAHKFSAKFFCICFAYRHHGPTSLHTTFSDLDLGRGLLVQQKAKPVGYPFCALFSDQDEIGFCVETIQMKMLILCEKESVLNQGK